MSATIATQGRYIVAKAWSHCFVGSQESIVRWVYDTLTHMAIYAQIQGAFGWKRLGAPDVADISESLADNDIETTHADFDIERQEALPDWAVF